MKTALILLSILGMACAFSMKNFYRRAKSEDSEENAVFKYRPRYSLYKYAYFYPPLKRFPVQSNSDSSEENGDGDSSEEEEEGETSNEEENNEENEDSNGNEEEESEAENTTLWTATPGYGEMTPGTGTIGLAGIQLPKKVLLAGGHPPKEEESDEEEEEEEENENEENEAEVDANEQGINGTSTNSTEVPSHGSNDADNGDEEGEDATEGAVHSTTVAAEQTPTSAAPHGGFEPTTPAQDVQGTPTTSLGETTTTAYEDEYEHIGTSEYDNGYEIYENENAEPRGDNYRAYEDEYSYYKGRSYDGYDGQNYY
ncbi:bone sialoprotein 2 [Sorex fumeus]|uniref:bone sialoprotein 2 n=1 Tax=Sorex fumeus TaxID=62283 RepID=UPI0024ACCEEC|nr:bone sialoprotein 2 [Sorex fumeus]